MGLNDTAIPNGGLMDISSCRVRLDGMGVAECLKVVYHCKWGVSHGGATLCGHPSAKQIAESTKRLREQLA